METGLVNNINSIIWLEIGLLFFGLLFIASSFFKQKDKSFTDEKVDKVLEDFIVQMEIENEEMIAKLQNMQKEVPQQLIDRLISLEKRLEKLEKTPPQQQFPLKVNQKYEDVIKLFDAGEDIDAIAKKTNMGHAEIKLILELSKKGLNYAQQ